MSLDMEWDDVALARRVERTCSEKARISTCETDGAIEREPRTKDRPRWSGSHIRMRRRPIDKQDNH